jgi:hypothetical protein
VNAEFQWWLFILGIVIGGALVYLVLADLQGDDGRDEEDAEPSTEPGGRTAGASAADGPDVESDGAQGEPPVADVNDTRPGHRGGQRGRVREPLE